MEQAAIYKFKKKENYLIHAVAKAKMGVGVVSIRMNSKNR
jgi:hypothetical protein